MAGPRGGESMRFQSPMAAVLAASITVSGCMPFQARTTQPASTAGSFRQAPTSELLTLAERYEQQGQYSHAARLYEEMLKSDPNRTQVRNRLQALAAHGIVSPHAQGALASNVDQVLAEHQRQVAASTSAPEPQQPSPTLASAPTRQPSPFYETSFSPEPVAAPVTVQPSADASMFPPPPSSRATQASQVPAEWQLTEIRSQQDTRPHPQTSRAADDRDAGGSREIAHAVTAGSSLWHASQPSSNGLDSKSTVIESPASDAVLEWAATPEVAATMPAAQPQQQSQDWWLPSETTAETDTVAMATDEAFYDPVVKDTNEEVFCEPTEMADEVVVDETAAATTSPMQQAQSAFTLWQVSGDASQAIPVLTEQLTHEDPKVVELACYFLGELGPAGEPAATQLREVRDSAESETTAILAAEALAKIEPEQRESIDHLIQATRSTEKESRLLAAITLADIDGSHSDAIVTALARMLDDENLEVRSAAALSLGGLGPAAVECTPKLEELALGDVPEVSDAARIALQCIEQ